MTGRARRTPVADGPDAVVEACLAQLALVRAAVDRPRRRERADPRHRHLGAGTGRPVPGGRRRPAEPGTRVPRHPAGGAGRRRLRQPDLPGPGHPGRGAGGGVLRGGPGLSRLHLPDGLDRDRRGGRQRRPDAARPRRGRRGARASPGGPVRARLRLRRPRSSRGDRLRRGHRPGRPGGRRGRAGRRRSPRPSGRPGRRSGPARSSPPRAPGTRRRSGIVADACDAFAQACVALVDVFNPALIVVGGSLAGGLGETLLGPARRAVAEHAFRMSAQRVRIVASELGDDVGLVGAAVLVARSARRIAASGGRLRPTGRPAAGRRPAILPWLDRPRRAHGAAPRTADAPRWA